MSGSSAAGHAALQPSLVTVLAQRSERSNPKIVRYVRHTYPAKCFLAGYVSGENYACTYICSLLTALIRIYKYVFYTPIDYTQA